VTCAYTLYSTYDNNSTEAPGPVILIKTNVVNYNNMSTAVRFLTSCHMTSCWETSFIMTC